MSGTIKCNICGNTENNNVHQVREMMLGLRDVFDYFECSECQCLQITEIPDNISQFYADNYYSFNYTPPYEKRFIKRNKVKLLDKAFIEDKKFLAWLILLTNKKLIERKQWFEPVSGRITSKTRFLDVGCGAGHFLHLLWNAGFTNTVGIDPFIAKDIEYEDGLKIQKKFIFDIDEKYDYISLSHSFEHMPNPIEVMKKISEILSDGGTCMIRIPVFPNYIWEKYGTDWAQIDAPRHFYLHSVKSMQILAEQAGLKIEEVVYDSWEFQFWGSEQYKNDIPLKSELSYESNPQKSIFTDEDIKNYKMESKKLNQLKQGDQATFYLKKA